VLAINIYLLYLNCIVCDFYCQYLAKIVNFLKYIFRGYIDVSLSYNKNKTPEKSRIAFLRGFKQDKKRRGCCKTEKISGNSPHLFVIFCKFIKRKRFLFKKERFDDCTSI